MDIFDKMYKFLELFFCRICDGEVFGIYYGVNICEVCKVRFKFGIYVCLRIYSSLKWLRYKVYCKLILVVEYIDLDFYLLFGIYLFDFWLYSFELYICILKNYNRYYSFLEEE